MLVYGRNVALDLFQNSHSIRKIYLQDGFSCKNLNSYLDSYKSMIKILSKIQMDDLVTGNHQGIILDIPDYSYQSLDTIYEKQASFVVVLDHIEDPHNLGAIIRTCEAAGVDAIILPINRSCMINDTVIKTSVGAVFHMDIIPVVNLRNTIEELKKHSFWAVGTSLSDCSIDYRDIDYTSHIALVIGNEGKGISPLIEKTCDFIAKIPMYGTTNSLNVSVATGIMIYEVIRNRKR